MQSAPPEEDLTHLLRRASSGDADAEEQVFAIVYAQLRKIAAAKRAAERKDLSLQATEIVHEAFMRLFQGAPLECADRAHFFRIVSRVMHNVLVDHARRAKAVRHGGGLTKVETEECLLVAEDEADSVLAVDEALQTVRDKKPILAEVFELHYYGGFTFAEIAKQTGRSERQSKRDWKDAKKFLAGHLGVQTERGDED